MVKEYQLRFYDEVFSDLEDLPEYIKPQIEKVLGDLEKKGPKIGTKLDKREKRDLSMFWKFYIDGTRYRLIYRLNHQNDHVVDVIAILERTTDLYDKVQSRIKGSSTK